VSIGGDEVGRIGRGLVVFVGISREDTEAEARYIADKVPGLRIFDDEAGRFDRSALDVEAELLIVSQFTLYANTRKGRRPSFTDAAPPEQAEDLFSRTVDLFAVTGLKVQTGRFRAHMMVSICNDGPVTIMLDSGDRERPRRG
jgi:D-tyrosyl-tRNA(Tyr) deacylase